MRGQGPYAVRCSQSSRGPFRGVWGYPPEKALSGGLEGNVTYLFLRRQALEYQLAGQVQAQLTIPQYSPRLAPPAHTKTDMGGLVQYIPLMIAIFSHTGNSPESPRLWRLLPL